MSSVPHSYGCHGVTYRDEDEELRASVESGRAEVVWWVEVPGQLRSG